MGRRRRKERRYSDRKRHFRSRKNSGWGMNLYRNTRESKIAGVAAGLADHWDIAHWVVRLMWVGAFLFTGTLALWIYVGAWVLMSPRPSRQDETAGLYAEEDYTDQNVDMEYDEHRHDYRQRNVFRYSDSGTDRLNRAKERLDSALSRVEDMESYVTSRQYNLNKEFSKL